MYTIGNIISRFKGGSLIKHSFWALFGNVIRQGLSLLSGIIIARFLGKDLYGEFGTIKITLTYIAIVSTFGFGYTATKYVAEYVRDKSGKIISLIRVMLRITLIFSTLLALLLFVFANQIAVFIDATHLAGNLKMSSIIIIVNAINSTQIGILSGFKEFKRIAKTNSYAGIVTFITSVFFTYWGGLDGAVCSLLVSFLFQVILNGISIRKVTKEFKNQKEVDQIEIMKILSFSTPIALQESLYTVLHWANLLVLIKYANYGEVGISSAASLWQSVVIFIPGVLKNVMFSHLITTVDHKRLVKKLLLIHFITTIIPFIFILLFSRMIVSFYGDSFSQLKPVLIIQICSAVFISLSEVYCYEFISIGKPWFVFFARLIRDLGAIIIGYLFVVNFIECQAFWMSIAALIMNIMFLLVLFILYKTNVINTK